MKRVIFNMYCLLDNNTFANIIKIGLPETGITMYNLLYGRKIGVSIRETKKSLIYDVWEEGKK